MKKRILSILLLCCMVLTMLPAPAFAAEGETGACASNPGGLCEHHPAHDEACGYTPQTEDAAGAPCGHVCEIRESEDSDKEPADPAGTSGAAMPMPLLGAARPAATQFTYTLHYNANGGSGAPPSQSETSSELSVWIPISEKIPTRDGHTFKGWADSPNGEPRYLREEGYYWNYLMVHPSLSETIYAIWEVHNHSWGEWTSNGNGTHKRICSLDSSHTETGSCSGGKATSTEKAICETCHAAYGELLQPAKTVITTPPTLRLPAYVGNEYTDAALMGGEAKAENTGVVVLGSFSFKNDRGGKVYPGENRMVILFTPNDTEAYTTAECIITVMGTKRTITRVPDDVCINNKPLGTAFEDLGLPSGVKVETNTGASFSPIPVTWDGSTYDPNKYGEQIITGELHVEKSSYTDYLEPTSTVRATARITLIDDRVFTPTLEPPTYSKQLYGGDLCFLVFSDKYLSGGAATANGETVSGKFTLDKDQKIYGHSLTASTLLQAGQLQLKVIFTPDNPKRYTKAECTIDVNVIPRKYMHSSASYITNKKFGTSFENLDLSDSFSFYAVGDENDPNGTGSNYDMPVVTSWDASTYDPNSFEEQTIYGTVDRAELEKYFTIPESADLRAVRKVRLEPDPAETEITQPPVFRWRNGDFTLPDNTIFTWRKLQVGTYNAEVGTLVGGVVKVKGTDTVAPGTFSFKEAPPFYLRSAEEHEVTVVFKPDDTRLHKPTETTIKINAIKNTIKDIDEPDPITDKSIGTPFAELGLPENVCINGVDGAWRWIEAAWDASSYDAESLDWQTITGTLVLGEDDGRIFQQPEPAVTAAIRVKLTVPDSPPTVTTETLPGGTEGEAYSQTLTAKGTAPITWGIASGTLPKGLSLNETTGEISGTPAGEETAVFTVKAVNALGEDTKELSITIAKAPEPEYSVTVSDDGHGTGAAAPSTAAAGTEITLTATPNEGYHLKEWKVMSGGVTITDDKFLMPEGNVTIEAIFEKDAPSAEDLVDPVIRIMPYKNSGYPTQDGIRTAADFFKPGEVPKGAKITDITPPASPSILDSISVDNDGLLSYAKNWADGEQLKTDVYTVTITSDDYAPISAPLTVRQYLFSGFGPSSNLRDWVYGDTRTFTWRVTNPGENGVWSAIMREQGIFEIYEETVDTTSEPGKSFYTIKYRAIKAGQTFIDILYVSDTTASWSPWSGSSVVAGGKVFVRGLTVTAGSAAITKGDALPTDLVTCTGLLDSEGRTDDRDTVLDNALSYRLLNANNEEVAADTARNTPGTYTVVPAATLKSGWDERYSLNRVNGTLTVEDKVEELFTVTVTSGGNGTASASPDKAVAGTEITLTATPNTGYHFKEWQVISGGVTIQDDKFLMPNDNVEVKAIFEKDAPPAPTEFIVTFDGNGGTPSVGSMTTTDQKLPSLPSASRSGSYSFDGWYTEKSGGTKVTTDTVFSANTTVYAHWTYTGGYNPPVTYCTLRFETGGGRDIPSVRRTYNACIDLTKYVPTWRGYTFIGWYSDRSLTNKVSEVYLTRDLTVYAGWRVDENPSTGENPFTDVSEKDWFFDDVLFVYDYGLMVGTGKTLFSPHETVTRGMMATILWRMEGSPIPKGKNSFTDVEAGKWYADAITWTAENGIFADYDKDRFKPDDAITREQLAAIFYRYADYKDYDLTVKGDLDKFKDADEITDYAKTAMQWAVGSDLVKGKSGDLLDPQGKATRAEIAAMLHRFIEKYELVRGIAPGGLMGWIDPKRL